jgi:hypothetical protein
MWIALFALLLGIPTNAFALGSISIMATDSQGNQASQVISDNDSFDNSGITGYMHTSVNRLGCLDFGIISGLTKPVLGTDEIPRINLGFIAITNEQCEIEIKFSEISYTISDNQIIQGSLGGKTMDTIESTAYAGSNNQLFDDSNILFSLNGQYTSFGGHSKIITAGGNGVLETGGEYSLTNNIMIFHTAGNDKVSGGSLLIEGLQ